MVAVKYKTEPTGTGLRNVQGSALMKVGRAWAKLAAQQKASSNVCFRWKPPKIMV